MYILKNAIRNIGRSKGRSSLTGAILFLVISAAVVSLIIAGSAGKVMAEYQDRFSVIASISPDLDQFLKTGSGVTGGQESKAVITIPSITPKEYLAYAQSDYLRESSLLASISCTSDTVKAVDQDRRGQLGGVYKTTTGASTTLPTLKVVCNSNTANLEGFQNGQRKIVDGRLYQKGNECVISEDLASLNGLSVGDTVEVGSVMAQGQPPYDLSVAGIYSDSRPAYADAISSQDCYQNRRNEILTGFETAAGRPGSVDDPGVSVQATYYLKSPDLLPRFAAEVRSKGLPDLYSVTTDEAGFDMTTQRVKSLRSISLIALPVLLVLGAGALILLSTVAMRERRKEFGVLRAMGMGKRQIARGLLYEMAALSAACLLAGVLVGSVLAQPVANILLEKQMTAEKKPLSIASRSDFGTVIVKEGQLMAKGSNVSLQPVGDIKVSLGWGAVLLAILIALMLAAASCLVGIRCVMRGGRPRSPTVELDGSGER